MTNDQDSHKLVLAIMYEIAKQKDKQSSPQKKNDEEKITIAQVPMISPNQMVNKKSFLESAEEQGQIGVADISIQDESHIMVRDPPK